MNYEENIKTMQAELSQMVVKLHALQHEFTTLFNELNAVREEIKESKEKPNTNSFTPVSPLNVPILKNVLADKIEIQWFDPSGSGAWVRWYGVKLMVHGAYRWRLVYPF